MYEINGMRMTTHDAAVVVVETIFLIVEFMYNKVVFTVNLSFLYAYIYFSSILITIVYIYGTNFVYFCVHCDNS